MLNLFTMVIVPSQGLKEAFINGGITKIEIEIKNICYSQKDLKISCKCGYQDQ